MITVTISGPAEADGATEKPAAGQNGQHTWDNQSAAAAELLKDAAGVK